MLSSEYLIVGAGFSGLVLAERLSNECGASCLIVEKRDHIGGNAQDEYDDHGVLIHKYGPHYFRTNSPKIREYLSRFTEWHPLEYKILSYAEGRYWNFPIDLNPFEQLIGRCSTGATEMFRSMAAVVAAKFGDQSLWNTAYPGLWRRLPEHWNRQVFLLPKFNLFPSGPASIWHFTRDLKPWHFEPGGAFGLVASWNHSLASVDWDMSATPRCRVEEPRLKALLKWAVSRIENLF